MRKAKEEMDATRAAFGTFLPTFTVEDGETVDGVWFVDPEPLTVPEHTGKFGPKDFATSTCSKGEKGFGSKCVGCYKEASGDKKYGAAKDRAYFQVWDPRWVHKIVDEERSAKAGKERYKVLPCTNDDDGDGDCKRCRKGMERERSGHKRYPMSMMWAAALDSENSRLSRKCVSCGNGKISLLGFRSEKTGKLLGKVPDGKDPEDYPAEYECSKCDNPQPGSIANISWRISRTGTSTNTKYNFACGKNFEEVPEEVSEIEPVDLAPALAPRPLKAQAKVLRCANPYEEGTEEAEEFDEDDEIIDDEDDESEEDSIKVKKPKGGAKRPPVRKVKGAKRGKPDDDEDEEDEEDDEDEESDDE